MDILRLVVAFIVVFGLLGGLYFVSSGAKRFSFLQKWGAVPLPGLRLRNKPGGFPAPEVEMRLVRKLYLTPHHQLHFISVHNEKILLCTHPQGCTVVQRQAEVAREVE